VRRDLDLRERLAATETDLDLPAIVSLLSDWYERGHRPLPWRATGDPYAIWISEIMLQQTQVATVIPFFKRFMARFPDCAALASAQEEDVLKLWEGLGYYQRARRLIPAARRLAGLGRWPSEAGELAKLPGIGRSTAGAIASIAFGRPAPILDGNVKRVWARLMAYDAVPTGKALSPLWVLSERAVAAEDPARVNQALMELGATLCIPRAPKCGSCPICAHCKGFQSGEPQRYPLRAPRRSRPLFDVSVALLWRDGRFLVTRRPSEGLLGGLWELPGGKWESGEEAEGALRRELREELGVEVEISESHTVIRHGYTHFEVRLHPFSCSAIDGREPRSELPMQWISPSEIKGLAFPKGSLKIFDSVFQEQSKAAEEEPSWR
jgi:A/G-specific adenine glycosylase